ncbi:MAG TPA: 6-phosphogluconolactonase [Ferruginibacter sp.]|nr:6-phosphogluconolactonase [Ferruginibacter sp.]
MTKLTVFDSPEILYANAADHIVSLCKSSIEKNGRCSIALSGGNTPRKLYELLATSPYASALPWKNIFIFWSDERCVPLTDKNNNAFMALDALLNQVDIPTENIFRIPVQYPPAEAAAHYERVIKEFFRDAWPVFDLVLLGLGDNGHTASLFPYTDILHNSSNLVKEVYVPSLDAYRISFTARLINHATEVLFLVSGIEKADILPIILHGKKDTDKYPAQLIDASQGQVLWYADKEAASKIKKK